MRYSEIAFSSCTHAPEDVQPRSPYPCHLGLFLRIEPFVYRRLNLAIGHGWPDYVIEETVATIRFPEPYDATGNISELCREWIIDCMRCAAPKLGMRMCVQFKLGDYAYVDESGDDHWSPTGPSGGVWI